MSSENKSVVKCQAQSAHNREYQISTVEDQAYYNAFHLFKNKICDIVAEMPDESDPDTTLNDIEIKQYFVNIARIDEEFQLDATIVKVMTHYLAVTAMLLLAILKYKQDSSMRLGRDVSARVSELQQILKTVSQQINIIGDYTVDQANAIKRIDQNTCETREMLPLVSDAAKGNMAAALRHYHQNVKEGLSKEAQAVCDMMILHDNKVNETSRRLKAAGWPHMSPATVSSILKKQIDPKFPRNNPFARMHGKAIVPPDSIKRKIGKHLEGNDGDDSD